VKTAIPSGPPTAATLATAIEAHRRARRVVLGHFFFFLVCCIAALLLRRAFKFPPQLTWVLLAVFGLVFSADLARLAYHHYKLQRLRAAGADA
jgi:threonine/homoserine/homoserine lactone efflux protein